MPLVGGGEEENVTGRGKGRRRMPLVGGGEEENGVHEWGTQSHTCKTWLTQYVMSLEHS